MNTKKKVRIRIENEKKKERSKKAVEDRSKKILWKIQKSQEIKDEALTVVSSSN